MSKRWCKWAQDKYPLGEQDKAQIIAALDAAFCYANGIRQIKPLAITPRQEWAKAHEIRKQQEMGE